MLSEIRKVGNSTGLILPKPILDKVHLHIGDTVEVIESNHEIVIRATKIHKKYKLEDLLSVCSPENMSLDEDDRQWLNLQDLGKERIDE